MKGNVKWSFKRDLCIFALLLSGRSNSFSMTSSFFRTSSNWHFCIENGVWTKQTCQHFWWSRSERGSFACSDSETNLALCLLPELEWAFIFLVLWYTMFQKSLVKFCWSAIKKKRWECLSSEKASRKPVQNPVTNASSLRWFDEKTCEAADIHVCPNRSVVTCFQFNVNTVACKWQVISVRFQKLLHKKIRSFAERVHHYQSHRWSKVGENLDLAKEPCAQQSLGGTAAIRTSKFLAQFTLETLGMVPTEIMRFTFRKNIGLHSMIR